MNLLEKVFAAAMLVACLVLLGRLVLGPGGRARFDATARRWGRRFGQLGRAARRGAGRPGPSAEEAAHARAERAAREAIERARRRAEAGEWDGNVYRPRQFGGRKKTKRDLH